MMKPLTTAQVEALWQGAGDYRFLAEMCEEWLDADGDAARQSLLAGSIRSTVQGSKLAASVGL